MDTTLIVKAPNGIEDQTINCQLNWTIKKLKNYLSEVYPNKPSTEEQKLIYSGQLLNDAVVLKDVLRQYDGQETHTVHLVFTPKSHKHPYYNKPNTSKMQSTDTATTSSSASSSTQATEATTAADAGVDSADGLRHRNVAGQVTPQRSETNNIPPINATQFAANYINPNLFYNTNAMYQTATTDAQPQPVQTAEMVAAQQLAMQNWMQMAYTQYMSQYCNMMSLGVRPETLYMPPAASTSSGGVPPNMAYITQTFPYTSTSQPQPPTSPQTQTPALATSQQQDPSVPAPDAAAGGGQVVENQAVEQQQAAVVRRFPNIIQEEQESRDWLDILYSMCRLTILLTLVYFYSSPIRCLIVIFVGIAIYMYHIGMFRQNQHRQQVLVHQQPPANGDNNNNVNNAQEPQVAAGENAENVVAPDANADQPLLDTAVVETNQSSNRAANVATIVRTFVVSFICSLIPDAPAL